jgi:pimeloyl-ACP methyl ester carboxylesterase
MTITQDKTTQFATLEDGRKLCFSEFGDYEGIPIMLFHGFPNSRLDGELLDIVAKRKKIRVITVDRPGFGQSDFQPKRKGASTGAAYAAACAYSEPSRFSKIGALSPLGAIDFPKNCICPEHRLAFQLAALNPIFFQTIFWWYRSRHFGSREKAVNLCKRNAKNLPNSDATKLLNPVIMDIIIRTQSEACRNGTKGIAYEASLLGKPWGFDLESISSKIEFIIWHGESDSVAPVFSAKEFEIRIPNCKAKYYPCKGHYSLPLDHDEEILDDLKK